MSYRRRRPRLPAWASVTSVVVPTLLAPVTQSARADIEVSGPAVAFTGARMTIEVTETGAADPSSVRWVVVQAGGERDSLAVGGAEPAAFTFVPGRASDLIVHVNDQPQAVDTMLLPGWLTFLPPLIAIVTALVTRQVLVSLLAGIFVGALFLARFNPLTAFGDTLDRYCVGSLANDAGHVTIVFMTLFLGGMTGVITRSGGARAVVDRLAERARGVRGAQLTTWLMGFVVFFDDYANTLIVGNTMRPLTDRLRISREKLSFLVDATAAPVASLAPISTWIGYEVGLIQDSLTGLGIERNGYDLVLASIPYRFDPIFLLVLGFVLVWTGRDFGAMLAAEIRARRGDGVVRPGGQPMMAPLEDDVTGVGSRPGHASTAWMPILAVILTTLGGILATGWSATEGGARSLRTVVAAGDSYQALLWAGAVGSLVAVILAVARRNLNLAGAMLAWVDGLRAMTMAMVILVLAWGIGAVCRDVGTADVLVGLLGDRFPAVLLPAAVFIISGVVSFATGTSWGTMAILIPIVVPLGYAVGGGQELLLVGTVSSVLAGSVFGDHCSPISDTTVLSSLASGADHVDHVRTQLPYALLAAAVAVVVGDLLTALGVPVLVSLALGVAILVVVVRWRGRPSEAPTG